MIGVHFLNNWGHNPDQVFELYRYLTPKHDGVWENIFIEKDFSKADYYTVLDEAPDSVDLSKIPAKQLIFLQREPVEIKPVSFKQDCLFFGSYENNYQAAFWRLKIPFDELVNLKPGKKAKRISSITSGKAGTPGQLLRLKALYQFTKLKFSIDIYGKGLDKMKLGDIYKGELNYNDFCKFEGLYPYQYSFACENSQHDNYFTEKIIDCFLTWTKPLYWGCPNISEYFPQDSYSLIDISTNDVVNIVEQAMQQPINYDALAEARKRALYEYNLMAVVYRIIENTT